jgi:aryl-alcohol dehydrogenase-like predicted oxidoreductase/histidinol phosphatase-like enzyme/predicted kinase
MGCMRLSTDPGRDESRAIEVLHAALDAGVTLLDTADAYALDASETGHNERLVARALAAWPGDRARVRIATKGGLTRPEGRWIPDGRARHLAAACDASCRALCVDRIPLYQLHVTDPRTPLVTSVRALATLQRTGQIETIGLCNVNVGHIEEARRIAEIAAVQVELGVWNDANVLSGVVGYCLAHGIQVIGYRPLGGPQRVRRTAADPLLVEIAARHGATPIEVALAWLAGLSDLVVPIPGPTRVATARSLGRVRELALGDEDRDRLDERFAVGRIRRLPDTRPPPPVPVSETGDMVLVMGLPAAGKSTVASALVAEGYARLNRDEAGGSLASLLPALDRLIDSGASRIVIDNTYVSRKSRAAVIAAARARGRGVRCRWLATSVEDAQVNAVSRMLSKHGRLLTPEEMKQAARRDVSAFGPSVQFRYQRELEPPHESEGFAAIERIAFERRIDPAATGRAVVVWCEGILRRSRSGLASPPTPADFEVLVERGATLRRFIDEGWRVLGLSWQPGIADGTVNRETVDAQFAHLRERLGVDIEVEYCPHGGGPPVCWCRKPLPGLGVVLIERHRLDPARCIYVGNGPQDPGFARRLGFQYAEAETFFASA